MMTNSVVFSYGSDIDFEARNAWAEAIYVELHFFLRVELNHVEGFTDLTMSGWWTGLDFKFSFSDKEYLLFAENLSYVFLRRVDAPDEWSGDLILKFFGPVANEENTVLHSLLMVMCDDFYLSIWVL